MTLHQFNNSVEVIFYKIFCDFFLLLIGFAIGHGRSTAITLEHAELNQCSSSIFFILFNRVSSSLLVSTQDRWGSLLIIPRWHFSGFALSWFRCSPGYRSWFTSDWCTPFTSLWPLCRRCNRTWARAWFNFRFHGIRASQFSLLHRQETWWSCLRKST
jgi:hypothetical protein